MEDHTIKRHMTAERYQRNTVPWDLPPHVPLTIHEVWELGRQHHIGYHRELARWIALGKAIADQL